LAPLPLISFRPLVHLVLLSALLYWPLPLALLPWSLALLPALPLRPLVHLVPLLPTALIFFRPLPHLAPLPLISFRPPVHLVLLLPVSVVPPLPIFPPEHYEKPLHCITSMRKP
jgi:hypothetical protein